MEHAKLAGMTDENVQAKTGKTWAQWTQELDAFGADQMTHRQIAQQVGERFPHLGLWWKQTVTVGYERIKGKRKIGQPCDSDTFTASKSKTLAVPYQDLYQAFFDDHQRSRWLDVSTHVGHASKRAIRLDWPDGSRVRLYFTDKTKVGCDGSSSHKTTVGIEHTRLASEEERTLMKQAWAGYLVKLQAMLS